MSDCIFCNIAAHEIPAKIVAESESILAFRDVNPQAPNHILLIPKKHMAGICDLKPEEGGIVQDVFRLLQDVVRQENMRNGFRLVVNEGPDALQSVPHLHFHLLAGRKMSWPPG